MEGRVYLDPRFDGTEYRGGAVMAAGGEAARHTASAVRNTIAQSLSPFCSDWDPGPWCGVTPL